MKLSFGVFCSRKVGFSILSPVIRREFHHSRLYHAKDHRSTSNSTQENELKEEEEEDDSIIKTFSEEELIEEFKREGPIMGEKEWRKRYSQSLKNIEQTMLSTLNAELRANMFKVKTYNKEKSTTPLDRIKYKFDDRKMELEDFYSKNALSLSLVKYLGGNSATEYQKKFLSLASSGLSTVAAGHQGSGKTIGLIIHALLLKRKPARGPGITSLVIVKSNEMCIRYKQIISEVYSQLPEDTKSKLRLPQVAQFLYRSTEQEEFEQNHLLGEYPNSHVLVTTPHRLLDILSTRGMDFVKIRNLPFIAVDDFDAIVGSPDNLSNKGKKALPLVQLLDYVLKLQDYNRSHNEPHPQLMFTTSAGSDIALLENLKYKEWFDWNRFVQVGSFDSEGDIPADISVPENVGVSTILVSPVLKPGNKKPKFSLYDMESFNYGSDLRVWLEKLFRSHGNDETYTKHRNVRRAEMSKEMKVGELEVLIHGFNKLLKKKNLGLKNKKILVVYPDEIGDRFIESEFTKICKQNVKNFDINTDLNFFVENKSVIHSSETEDGPKILLIKSSTLNGLCFKGLNSIVCLGIDCIKTPSHFFTISGRFRDESGLIVDKNGVFLSPERKKDLEEKANALDAHVNDSEDVMEDEDYVDYDEVYIDDTSNSEIEETHGFSPAEKNVPENRIYLLQSKLDFSPIERNYLERLFIKGGLVRQVKSIGVTEPDFEKEAYEDEFSRSEFEIRDF